MTTTNDLTHHITRWSINSKRQESSDDIILSLARAVPPLSFTIYPVKTLLGGTAVCIDLDMGKSRLYGIGNLIWRSGVTISSKLLTTGRQWNSTRRTNLRYGRKRTGKTRKMMEKAARMRTKKMTRKTEKMRSSVKTRNNEKPIPMLRKSSDQYENGDTQDNGDRQDNWEEHVEP